jgi:hypothetical protein
MPGDYIKKCDVCGAQFTAREFAESPMLVPIGIMALDEDACDPYFLFQHDTDDCGSSVLIRVTELREFVTEESHQPLLMLSEQCERHCVNLNDTAACTQECRIAPYRRFLNQLIEKKWRMHVDARM